MAIKHLDVTKCPIVDRNLLNYLKDRFPINYLPSDLVGHPNRDEFIGELIGRESMLTFLEAAINYQATGSTRGFKEYGKAHIAGLHAAVQTTRTFFEQRGNTNNA